MKIFICLCVSILAIVNGSQQLFAVIGANACAENLYYGPQSISKSGSADGLRSYYLSTSTASNFIPHKEWLQIVTSDGTNELFRIYWTFSTARTLAEHFSTAVSSGESVIYRIVDTANGGSEYYKSGDWRFSTGSRLTTSTFNVATTTCCFSADDGAWGAGSGTIQPDRASNNYYTTSFWGIGNWDSSDSSGCANIYRDGVLLNNYPNSKTYMYYEGNAVPSAAPTQRPTSSSNELLFAVVGGDSCAEDLYYGPQSISTAGSADGKYPYFLSTSTAAKDVAHTEWLQIVTSNDVEQFRIYWAFSTARTLADRFQTAVSSGEAVTYTVVDSSGIEYVYSGTWWFSNGAGSMSSRFASSTTQCCFSSDDGAWGGGSGTIQANGNVASSFWGIGNWDNSDYECSRIYKQGTSASYGTSTQAYMYYFAEPGPTLAPSRSPSCAPSTLVPTLSPSLVPSLRPTALPTTSLPTVPVSQLLFAVVGGNSCAEDLYYGPQRISTAGSADGKYPYFLSTSTAAKDVAHNEWLQIVTSNDVEQFRIYWTFFTAKTLADRFQTAVSSGEAVTYTVVDSSGIEYVYSGTWWFSNGAGSMSSRFATSTTQCCFSSDDGAWGGGSGTIQANGNVASSFWGIGNWNSADYYCSRIYKQGSYTNYGASTKTFMYYYSGLNPTLAPSQAPTSSSDLFAVVGGNSCAETLYYGPQTISTAGSADGLHEYFLSTSAPANDIAHTDWLQIVTSDGSTELFRIYWAFSTAKTLADRFQTAVSSGEAVTWRVVDSSGIEYAYSSIWRYSNGAGGMNSRFATYTTQCCFSDDDGAWGGGASTVDGNGAKASVFWGIGNFDSGDFGCSNVYSSGSLSSSYGSNVKVYMYSLMSSPQPHPVQTPTLAPASFTETLFAVVGDNDCAEQLHYGPQSISTAGSADGQYEYFLSTSTANKLIPHRYWLQIVTSDGSTELFRIYWAFSTAKTLADRFQTAVSSGEAVTYTVVDSSGIEYVYSGTWWFSNGAGSMSSRFATSTTQCCFSSDDGAWGGGSGTIQANGNVASSFWGIGNFDSGDSSCSTVYRGGVSSNYGSNVKVYMYYSTTGVYTQAPTVRPSPAPTSAPAQIKLQVSQDIRGVAYSDYQANQAVYDSVIQQTIVDSVSGASRSSVQDYQVTAGSNRRALSGASILRSAADSAGTPSLLSSSASIRAQYRLVLSNTGQAYDTVRTQLEDVVQSGSFDAFLQNNALAQGATGLTNASSSAVSVQDATDYSSSDDDSSTNDSIFTLPVIIGVAGGVGALIIVGFFYFFCRTKSSVPEQLPSSNNTTTPTESPHRLQPIPQDPAAAKDISRYFYGAGLSQPHALVPSAPPDNSDYGIELGTTIGTDDHHYGGSSSATSPYASSINSSSAPTMDSIYQHNTPSIPVAAVAVPVSACGPYVPGESVVFAQVYTGEVEETKD